MTWTEIPTWVLMGNMYGKIRRVSRRNYHWEVCAPDGRGMQGRTATLAEAQNESEEAVTKLEKKP